jgi:amino acid transporter
MTLTSMSQKSPKTENTAHEIPAMLSSESDIEASSSRSTALPQSHDEEMTSQGSDKDKHPSEFESPSSHDTNKKQSQKTGYKPELMRGLNLFMSFAYSFTVCAIIPGITLLYNFGLSTGGPAIMVWSWVVVSVLEFAVGLCLAEICSTYPHAGSVYYWSGQLASKNWQPLSSFLCGWINLAGNMANTASFANGCVSVLTAAITMYNGYSLSNGAQVGISIALLSIWTVQNVFRIDQQGWVTTVGALVQLFGSFALVITALSSVATKSSSEFVFTSTYNGIGLNNTFYLSLIGILIALYSYGGFEAGSHLAEETKKANKAAPRGIVFSIVLSFVAGFFIIVGLLYCTPTTSEARAAGYPTGIDLLLSTNGSTSTNSSSVFVAGTSEAVINLFGFTNGRTGGFVLSIILALIVYLSGMTAITATSRLSFAMARDKALPLSKYLSIVNSHTKSPIGAVLFVFVVCALLLLLPLVSTTAFTQIVSISSVGYQISYGIPILLRLTIGRQKFRQNAFSLGRFSIVIGWVATIFCFLTAAILLLPQQFPVTATNMNYASVVFGGFILLGLFYWALVARYHFYGPKNMDANNKNLPKEDQTQPNEVKLENGDTVSSD